ncbi:hypothetical protein [Actinobacillus equuli]|uniref:hypothetical protein n=1 Tax=Actinobacillus equuli TaxID=718 RepID=UPI0024430BF0|nr:hypothetical protein [Actinobacillus equuli]WGE85915.1 hypothetical protein NYR87_01520 [Actinobacillus equuli subsp. haemolyticus]
MFIDGNAISELPLQADEKGRLAFHPSLVEREGKELEIKVIFWNAQYPKMMHSKVPAFTWLKGKKVVRLRAYNLYEMTPRAMPNENNEPATYKRPYHVIRRGDTWESIEQEAGVNRYALLWENGLDEATPLETLVGKKIYFPRGVRKGNAKTKTPTSKPTEKKKERNVLQVRSENNGKPVDVIKDKKNNPNGYYYEAATGHYHSHLTKGIGNINDVYVYLDIKDNKYISIKKLPVKDHSDFIIKASTIYGESSAFRASKVTQDELKKEMYSIASVHQKNKKAYGISSNQAKIFRSKSNQDRNNTAMQFAIAALINALNNGPDHSNGADMWDGMEQALFPSRDDRRSTGRFELHMNTMGWDIYDDHYEKWKNSVDTILGKGKFLAPQKKAAPENYGNYKNKGKMRLKSKAVYCGTIFWSSR